MSTELIVFWVEVLCMSYDFHILRESASADSRVPINTSEPKKRRSVSALSDVLLTPPALSYDLILD